MQDNEIIKALECCSLTKGGCEACPLHNRDGSCTTILVRNSLDLIKFQKSEIETLKGWESLLRSESHAPIIKKARTEALKDFAERAVIELTKHYKTDYSHWIDDTIYSLAKEMMGDCSEKCNKKII